MDETKLVKVEKIVISDAEHIRFTDADGLSADFLVRENPDDPRFRHIVVGTSAEGVDLKRTLIETSHQVQILNGEENNLHVCLFLLKGGFRGITFAGTSDRSVMFYGAIFAKNAYFEGVTFEKHTTFYMAKFLQGAKFQNVKFLGGVEFVGAEFLRGASFQSGQFSQSAGFAGAKFMQIADFRGVSFSQNAVFADVQFSQGAKFDRAQFSRHANFSEISGCETMSFNFCTFGGLLSIHTEKGLSGKIKIDLQGASLKTIMYDGREFASDNRETFLILKNFALAQNDSVRASEFYTQEMNTHYKNIKLFSKNWGDVLILTFEKMISNFGASAWRAILAFAVFNLIFSVIYKVCYGVSWDDFLKVHLLIKDLKGDDIHFSIGIFRYIQTAFNIFFIYEIQKSLRKFSRKF